MTGGTKVVHGRDSVGCFRRVRGNRAGAVEGSPRGDVMGWMRQMGRWLLQEAVGLGTGGDGS